MQNFSLFYYGLSAIIALSLLSFVGSFIFLLSKNKLASLVPYLVSIAIGALLGDAIIHLLPEAFVGAIENASSMGFSIPIVVGFVGISFVLGFCIFYILEKYIHWHHHHDTDEDEHAEEHGHGHGPDVGIMVSIGDGIHNFIDGIIIGLAFLINIEVGIATTIAVILHEIPQEIGDMGVLVFAGWSRAKALFVNFLSACTAILGYMAIAILADSGSEYSMYIDLGMPYLLAFASGGFIYIAIVDLIPDLKMRYSNENTPKNNIFVKHIAVMVIGVLVMASLLLFE